jgi:hypothetical protein
MTAQSLNDVLGSATISYCLAGRQDAVFDDPVADELLGPYLLGEFLFGHHPAAVLEQIQEHLPRFGRQSLLALATMHDTQLRIQFTVGKTVLHDSAFQCCLNTTSSSMPNIAPLFPSPACQLPCAVLTTWGCVGFSIPGNHTQRLDMRNM